MPIKVNEAIMNKFDFDVVNIQSYSKNKLDKDCAR